MSVCLSAFLSSSCPCMCIYFSHTKTLSVLACLSIYLSASMYVCLFVCVCLYAISVSLSVCLYACINISLPVSLHACFSTSMPVCLPVCLSISLSGFMTGGLCHSSCLPCFSVCMSVCLSVCLLSWSYGLLCRALFSAFLRVVAMKSVQCFLCTVAYVNDLGGLGANTIISMICLDTFILTVVNDTIIFCP